MAATTADLVNQFIELDEKKKKTDEDLEAIKSQMAKLETQIMERFENAGMQSMKSKDGQVVYIRRDLRAGAVDGASVLLMEALKSAGAGDLVKEAINHQRLSSWVREIEEEKFAGAKVKPEELLATFPASLQSTLKITEQFSLRCKKG